MLSFRPEVRVREEFLPVLGYYIRINKGTTVSRKALVTGITGQDGAYLAGKRSANPPLRIGADQANADFFS